MIIGNTPYNSDIEGALPENRDMVMVNGKILKLEGKLTGIDTEALITKASNRFQ